MGVLDRLEAQTIACLLQGGDARYSGRSPDWRTSASPPGIAAKTGKPRKFETDHRPVKT